MKLIDSRIQYLFFYEVLIVLGYVPYFLPPNTVIELTQIGSRKLASSHGILYLNYNLLPQNLC